ncbi:DgyrCDS6506 [Dimorphilus gyrociliatus]|uniref:DgyrCDS6506 n=1 Tax=Dimorphilus gyrociliatus TaxID=2664684 RepID=A0A7I8VN95_9ANNE|nr:DgyrCDS6506 [Dimorphilus gyrociliatus]
MSKKVLVMSVKDAKQQIHDSIDSKSETEYWDLMRSWFRGQIDKKKLDSEAKRLLPKDSGIRLHNNFILSLLAKVAGNNGSESTPSIYQTNQPAILPESDLELQAISSFTPIDPLLGAPILHTRAPHIDQQSPAFIHRQYVLPDDTQIHGRMLVSAWEYGLDEVSEDAVQLLVKAIEEYLKNILIVILGRLAGCVTSSSPFKCNPLGITGGKPGRLSPVDSNLYDEMEDKELEDVTRHVRARLHFGIKVVSLFDVLDGLQSHPEVIQSRTCLATNLQRIISKLWYSEPIDMQQDYD